MSANRQDRINNKSKKKRKRLLAWFLLPILVIGLGGAAYATFLYSKAESVMSKSYKPIERESKRVFKNVPVENTSILFIGVDDSSKRKEGNPRSDALMVATFNKKDKSIKLLSIPRDSYVHIPEKNIYTKITHAHAYGGVKLTLDTVEELLDMPINYYVKMNFNAFMDVINALGGIDANVPYTFTEQDSKDHKGAITLQKGMQHLNGEQALALARTRHYDSDIYRGQRQQEIMKAILSQATSVKNVTNYSKVIEAVGKNMTTDLTFDQMLSFIKYLQAGSGLNTQSLTIKGSDDTINGIYYYKLDQVSLDETKLILKNHLLGKTSTSSSDTTGTSQ
ncbi:LCP family protein [Neobacillus niacini]|uniref:LCP family protein n=1 Tax=Neobacillus niacini TaxID=86668 RepID=UPI0028570A18|nr:LCP family protein [Neobacillus niacini]MDR6998817.1 LCP family protein required for cell wall assembly [Neobacillus niacini]